MELLDKPYIDLAQAAHPVGGPAAQREAQVLLEHRAGFLPLRAAGKRVWLHRIDTEMALRAGFTVVDNPAQADLAIVRMDAPAERLHLYHFFGSRQNEGRLHLADADHAALRRSAALPTLVAINRDRPAILNNVRGNAAAWSSPSGRAMPPSWT